MGIPDPTKLIQTIGKQIDENTESGEERQKELTRRLELDMASDNWLSKSIRPLIVLGLFFLFVLIIVAEWSGATIPTDTKITVGTIFGTSIAFYFESKRKERIAGKSAEATMKIKHMELKHEQKMQKKEFRRKRRQQPK